MVAGAISGGKGSICWRSERRSCGNGSGRKGAEDLRFGRGGFGKKGADRVWARRAAKDI